MTNLAEKSSSKHTWATAKVYLVWKRPHHQQVMFEKVDILVLDPSLMAENLMIILLNKLDFLRQRLIFLQKLTQF